MVQGNQSLVNLIYFNFVGILAKSKTLVRIFLAIFKEQNHSPIITARINQLNKISVTRSQQVGVDAKYFIIV